MELQKEAFRPVAKPYSGWSPVMTRNPRHTMHRVGAPWPCWLVFYGRRGNSLLLLLFFFLQCGHFDFEFAVAAGQETQYLASILTGRLVQCISCNIHCALVKRREVKCYLDFHWVARPRRRTLTNGSDVKDVFPRCLLHSLYDQHWQQHWGRGALPHNGPWSEIRALPRTSRLLISNLRLRSYKPVSFFQVNWLEPSCALENGHFKQIQMQSL